MDIIKALQENKEAFGLMEVQMINEAERIGKGQFEIWGIESEEVCSWLGFKSDEHSPFIPERTYRLRPDYAPAPSVVTELKFTKWEAANLIAILQKVLDR